MGGWRRLEVGLTLAGVLLLTGCEETTVVSLEVASVEIAPSEVTLIQGETGTLSATPMDAQGRALSGRTVEWSVDDDSVVRLVGDGELETGGPGETVVRARTSGVEGSARVEVLAGPSLELDREVIELEALAGASQQVAAQVEVSNAGNGRLSGLSVEVVPEAGESDPPDWLTASLDGSEAPATLTVRAHAGSLESGEYRGRVEVSSPVALNEPRSVLVIFAVEEPPPILEVNPSSISLSGVTGSLDLITQDIRIENAGGGVLEDISVAISYPAGQVGDWLQYDLERTEAPTTLTLSASTRRLDPGSYTATVEIRAPVLDEAETVTVLLQVGARP